MKKTLPFFLVSALAAVSVFAGADSPVMHSPRSSRSPSRLEAQDAPAAPPGAVQRQEAEARHRAERDASAAAERYRAGRGAAASRQSSGSGEGVSHPFGAGEGWSYAATGENPRWEGFRDFGAFYGGGNFYQRFLRGKLAVGVGASFPVLDDASRPQDSRKRTTFLGNIVEEKNARDANLHLALEYTVCPFLRLMFSFYALEIDLYNQNKDHACDGTASLKGPLAAAKLQYPVWDGRILPYATAGVAFLRGDFDASDWWRYRYSTEADFEATGSQNVLRGTRYRMMEVDGVTAFVWGGGMAWRPFEHWEVDGFVTFMDADADAEFFYLNASRTKRRHAASGSFSFDNHQFGVAAKYVF